MEDNDPQKHLEPTALDGSPGQAFAGHKARANGIAKYFALTRPLEPINGTADENNTTALLAHLHAASHDPNFAVPGQEASRTLAPKVLRRLNRGDGRVGTEGKYDFALKGLMTIAYRYRHLLSDDDFNFILDELVPANISGGHPPEVETLTTLGITYPESENHLLMIESSRYLINQLLHDRTGDSKYNNSVNGLSSWLLGYMQTIAKHDFMEFNARPYARLALHPLYNLHELAREEPIRTAAQILLDYVMIKFAVSSNRGRRVSPFRRLQPRITHQANARNDLYHDSGDQVAGYFMAYTGFIDSEGKPAGFPEILAFTALLSGTAAYRPPPAAYILAMNRDNPPSLHRFYHGTRPRVRGSPDIADGGLEIYYRSPSFLLSAGGMFLNSGYGHDEIGKPIKKAWRDTSRAQATTMIPTRADTKFADLIRFEPYPDPLVDPYVHDPENDDDKADSLQTHSVNIGVQRGLAAGANLRPAEKKTVLEHSTSNSPVLAFHTDRLLVAWKGSGNDNLNVAKVQETSLLEIDGVEGVEETVTLADADTTDSSPALASHNGRLFLAWKGSGNDNLNLAFSEDNGASFRGKTTLPEVSSHSPSLASHAGRLFLAWKGSGNKNLNVAKVVLLGNIAGGFGFELEGKVVLGETSTEPPALASHNGRLFLAWKGEGDDNLNLRVSRDGAFQAAGPWLFSNLEHLGFFGAAYRTPPARPGDLDPPPDNLALVYAMEAKKPDGMDFNRFRELTLARNSDLPAQFDYGGFYKFHAADDKHFSIWFQLSEQKYQARIVDLDDPNSVGDLSTLPLVSGDYMKAPGGHDGLIEIRHPGCDVPLILDYRDAAHPVRSDNAQACPQPLVDRARAIMAYSLDLISKAQAPIDPAKPVDPVDALRTAVDVFRGFDPPAAILSEYLLAYGQAVYALIAFLLGIGRVDEALSLVREGIGVELAATNAPGADVMRVAASLSALSVLLSAASRPHEAALVQQALVDVLLGFTPPAETRLEYLLALAEGRHNLIARLIDDQRVEQAAALVADTLAAYRDYVGQPGADVMRVARDLPALSALLSAASRPHEAALVQQALDAIV